MPIEPPPSSVAFPPASEADEHGRVFVGGDLEPGTLLRAYRSGLFPMRLGDGRLAWWCPEPRGILRPEDLRISGSLARAQRRFEIRVDSAFEAVIAACAEREEGEYVWITEEIQTAYLELHRLGWAHSVEAWAPADDGSAELVGGLYGVAIGGVFAGESMFHRRRDASKVALVHLVELLREGSSPPASRIIDVQWLTPHLASLGAVEIGRARYLAELPRVLAQPLPPGFIEAPPRSTP